MSIRLCLLAAVSLLAACSGATSEVDPDFVPPVVIEPTPAPVIPASVRIIFGASSLASDADDPAEGVAVRAVATDNSNRSVAGAKLAFGADSGVIIVGETETDSTGTITAILTTGGDPTVRPITVTASVPGTAIQGSGQIMVQGAPSSASQVARVALVADGSTLPADASTPESGRVLTAIVTDANGNLLPNAPLTFRLAVPNAALQVMDSATRADGTGRAILTTGGDSTARSVTVTVTSGTISGSLTLPVGTPTDPSAVVTRIVITSNRSSLTANDTNFSTGAQVNAVALNSEGQVVPGVPLSLSISGGGAIQPQSSTTDATGTVTAGVSNAGDPSPRTLTVTARSGSATASFNLPVVAAVQPPVARIAVAADRLELDPNDSTADRSVTLTAIVTDSQGQLLPNVSVAFAISAGGGALQTLNSGLTNSDGEAFARLTTGGDTRERTITVTATSAQVSGFIQIEVTPGPSAVDRVAGVQLISSKSFLDPGDSTLDRAAVLTATAVDSSGVAQPGVPVDFAVLTANGTLVIQSASTDANGQATASLTTGGNPTERTISVRATSNGFSATVDVLVKPDTIESDRVARVLLNASRSGLFIDEDTFASGLTITATALDAAGAAVSNVPLSFSIVTGGGAISVGTGRSTDAQGMLSTDLHSAGGEPREITVRAVSGNAQQDIVINVVQRTAVDPVARIALSVSRPFLSTTDDTTAKGVIITAQYLDSNGVAVDGATGSFAIVSGGGALSVNPVQEEDAPGTQQATLHSAGGEPRDILVRVASGSAEAFLTVPVRSEEPVNVAIRLLAAAPTIPSGAQAVADGLLITAVATDDSNRRVKGAVIELAADSGALSVNETTTDQNGELTAILTTNGDPSLRTITVTATGTSSVAQIAIPVVGTTLVVNAPSVLGVGESITITADLTDSNQSPIVGRPVTLTSSLGNPVTSTPSNTDAAGRVRFGYQAASGGTDDLRATGLGINTDFTINIPPLALRFITPRPGDEIALGVSAPVEVELLSSGSPLANQAVFLTATRGSLAATTVTTNADGRAATTLSNVGAGGVGGFTLQAIYEETSSNVSGEFVSLVPASLQFTAQSTSIAVGMSTDLTAVVRDASGNPVKNTQVNFNLNDPTLGSLNRNTAITDSTGRAVVTYTAGSTTSSPDAITVTATVSGIPSQSVRLTVGGQALRIALGTSNIIGEDNTGTFYELPYSVLVTDSSGNPVSDVEISLRVESLTYQKGAYQLFDQGDGTLVWQPVYAVPPVDGAPGQDRFGCLNEDANRNGTLDPTEDFNGNGRLDPGNVAASPAIRLTDSQGQATFFVRYIQEFASWSRIRLTASAQVAGSESAESVNFVLPISSEDALNSTAPPPGRVSPFGVESDCANPG